MQPQFNDDGFVPVVVPGALVLLPLPGLTLREPVRTPTRQVWPFLAPSQQSLIPFERDS